MCREPNEGVSNSSRGTRGSKPRVLKVKDGEKRIRQESLKRGSTVTTRWGESGGAAGTSEKNSICLGRRVLGAAYKGAKKLEVREDGGKGGTNK